MFDALNFFVGCERSRIGDVCLIVLDSLNSNPVHSPHVDIENGSNLGEGAFCFEFALNDRSECESPGTASRGEGFAFRRVWLISNGSGGRRKGFRFAILKV
jgi:hypothetical protein